MRKIAQTSAFNDRRLKKDALVSRFRSFRNFESEYQRVSHQDSLTRLIENTININAVDVRDGTIRSPALGEKTQLGVSPRSLAMETVSVSDESHTLPKLTSVASIAAAFPGNRVPAPITRGDGRG